MITFKELRSRLSAVTYESEQIHDLLVAWECFFEDSTFYIYRTDTNAVLASGIHGFEAAKARASQLRKSFGLKFDDIKFKSERLRARGAPPSGGSDKTFSNSSGHGYPIQYSSNYNPSKRGRFRGYTDAQGNFHDID